MEFLHHVVSFVLEQKQAGDRVLTVEAVLEVGGFEFFGFGDQWLIWLRKRPSYSLCKAETNFFF